MIDIHRKYIIDENNNQSDVILPIKEYRAILERLEELEDIEAYDRAKEIDDEIIPFDVAIKN